MPHCCVGSSRRGSVSRGADALHRLQRHHAQMSLTSLLRAGRGPVWDWFETTLPETQRLCTSANRELRGGGTKEPCAVPPVPGTDHGLVGTAVGYLLSAHLRPDALDHTVATEGARRLDRPLRRVSVMPSVIRVLGLDSVRDSVATHAQ